MSQDVRDGSVTLAGVTLPSRWAAHPVVAAENVRPGWDATHVWFSAEALLVRLRWRERTDEWRWSQHTLAVEVDDDGASVLAVGSPSGAARLILAAGEALAPVTRTSVPRGTHVALRELAASGRTVAPLPFAEHPPTEWDWFHATQPPRTQPGEEHVTELTGDDGLAAAARCLRVANPHGELDVSEPRSRWWGWCAPDDGADAGRGADPGHGIVVRGVAGASRRVPGQPWVLGSIGTDPSWRGRGLAAAVTAAAMRAGVAETGRVTLGMYAHNAAARRLYLRLGFRVAQEFESWRP